MTDAEFVATLDDEPAQAQRTGPFPLPPPLSANLIRSTNRGTLTAEARIVHRGRTTLVVDVEVLDERERVSEECGSHRRSS